MIVKNFVKLALLFILSFVIIFLASTGFRFLSLHVNWIKTLPPRPETSLVLVIAAAKWALTCTLFSAILFSLSYTARKKYNNLMSIITIICLSLALCFGVSALFKNLESVPSSQTAARRLGGNGLILSNSVNRNETSVVLLKGNTQSLGPRVVASSGQPLSFQETAEANFYLPPIPFGDDTPWFLKSLAIDIRLNSEILQNKFNEGLFPFLIFAGSLVFLLSSLGYIIKISAWPLVNLFLGILFFRGILAFETFIYTPEMLDIINSFLKGIAPEALALPLIFTAAGALIHLYSFLVFILRRRVDDDE